MSQIIKLEASGNATRWQGYVAREGFGITRIKNHIRAAKPVNGKSSQTHRGLWFVSIPDLSGLPVTGQVLCVCVLF
jgi:hypothetical protein